MIHVNAPSPFSISPQWLKTEHWQPFFDPCPVIRIFKRQKHGFFVPQKLPQMLIRESHWKPISGAPAVFPHFRESKQLCRPRVVSMVKLKKVAYLKKNDIFRKNPIVIEILQAYLRESPWEFVF